MATVEELTRNALPGLSEDVYQRLDRIAAELVLANQSLNLTSLTTPEEIAYLHFYDSLSLLQTGYFTEGKAVLDVGCGGGFPALPLAASTACTVTANDATAKKLRFVAETAEKAGIPVFHTLCGRAEELGLLREHREQYDIVVSRGVARMNILCEWCLPFVKVGGVFIAMKGNHGRDELAEAGKAIQTLGGQVETVIDVPIPQFARDHTLLVIKKIAPTDTKYPRSNGRITKKPL